MSGVATCTFSSSALLVHCYGSMCEVTKLDRHRVHLLINAHQHVDYTTAFDPTTMNYSCMLPVRMCTHTHTHTHTHHTHTHHTHTHHTHTFAHVRVHAHPINSNMLTLRYLFSQSSTDRTFFANSDCSASSTSFKSSMRAAGEEGWGRGMGRRDSTS